MLQSFGGDLVDRSTYTTAEGALNGDKALAWGEWFQGLFADGYANPKPADDQCFLQGRCGLWYTGSWSANDVVKALGDDALFLPAVDFGNGPKIGGASWQWGISSACEHPDGAWQFIEHVMQPENIALMSQTTGLVPTTAAAAALTENYKDGGPYRVFYEMSDRFAVLRPATPGYLRISSEFEQAGLKIRDGNNVQDALLLMVGRLPSFSLTEGFKQGWLNTYHVQIIPFIVSAFSIFLFYQFFRDIPKELDKAALVVYASGSFDGQSFVPDHQEILVHGGPEGCFYAPQAMRSDDGRYLMWGWLHEGRSDASFGKAGWAGAMSLPLVASMEFDGRLCLEPAAELTSLRREHRHWGELDLSDGSDRLLDGVTGDSLEIVAQFQMPASGEFGLTVRASPDGQEATRLVVRPAQHHDRAINGK